MAEKGIKTTATYIEWHKAISLIKKLERDKNYKFQIYIALSIFTGLRFSDIVRLSWEQVVNQKTFRIVEVKTMKTRNITINEDLRIVINNVYNKLSPHDIEELIFINRWGDQVITNQYVNTTLKKIAIKYNLNQTISSHSLRKTFGRKVYDSNGKSEHSLVLLSQIFSHSSLAITRLYLGLRDEEIRDVYINLNL
jgi:integrase